MDTKNFFDDISFPMIFGLVAGLAAAIVLGITSYRSDDVLLWLFSLIGASLGWLVGILSVPLNKDEKSRFGEFGKILAGFLTGYLVSKTDQLVGWFLQDQGNGDFPIFGEPTLTRFLVLFASFLVVMIIIFNARSYWSSKNRKTSPKIRRAVTYRRTK